MPNYRHDWPSIIAEFKQSGLSQNAFCKQKGLALSSFNHQFRRQQNQITSPFVRVAVDEPKSPALDADGKHESILLEVGTCKIHWPSQLPVESLARFVKHLS